MQTKWHNLSIMTPSCQPTFMFIGNHFLHHRKAIYLLCISSYKAYNKQGGNLASDKTVPYLSKLKWNSIKNKKTNKLTQNLLKYNRPTWVLSIRHRDFPWHLFWTIFPAQRFSTLLGRLSMKCWGVTVNIVLDYRVQLTISVLVHLKGVWHCWSQSLVCASKVLPHQTWLWGFKKSFHLYP